MAKGIHVAIRVRYSDPIFNQQNGIIVRGIPRDWSRRIHSVNKIPRPNSPRCTYRHQIGHQINECPFIEDNVKQGFVKHFQNMNPKLARVRNHGHIELEDLYHERVKFQIYSKKQNWK
jgi:hypothetical protein